MKNTMASTLKPIRVTHHTEGRTLRGWSFSPTSLIRALWTTASEEHETEQGSHHTTVTLTGSHLSSFFSAVEVLKGKCSVCTWIGETAAAGAVRMGIPLSGLLAEEGIWTVWLGPSERADKTPSDYRTGRLQNEVQHLFWHLSTDAVNQGLKG